MQSIKLSYKQEVRRIQIDGKKLTFNGLLTTAQSMFPVISSSPLVSFQWIDDENDNIKCSTDEELREALRVMGEAKRTFKFEVVVDEEQQGQDDDDKVIHDGISCDGCGMSPIVGPRFKCSVRENFDLCKGCEAAEIPPFPMLKIAKADQAPAFLFVALRDEEAGHGGHRGRRFPHGGPRRWGPQRGHGPGPRHHWQPHGRCHWRKHAQNVLSGLSNGLSGDPSGIAAAAGAFARALSSDLDAIPGAQSEEDADVEPKCELGHTLVQAPCEGAYLGHGFSCDGCGKSCGMANRWWCSTCNYDLCFTCFPVPVAEKEEQVFAPPIFPDELVSGSTSPTPEPTVARKTPAELSQSSSALVSAPASATVPAVPAVPVVPSKPMAAFVCDVTVPDGTHVNCGARIVKTWRMRNDGQEAWPEGTRLTCAGGDVLCASDLAIDVPAVASGAEVEISVELTVPHVTGRIVAYFRLCTKEGRYFGQRLWADIRVIEEVEWQVVSDPDAAVATTAVPSSESAALEFVPFSPSAPALSAEAEEMQPPVDEAVGMEAEALQANEVDEENRISEAEAEAADMLEQINDLPAAEEGVSAAMTPAALAVWSRVWEKELQVLRDMGFGNTAEVLPLLQQHVGVPVSLCPELNGVPPAEGMQRVVGLMLSRSGAWTF